jgi:hypothetical protein
MRFTFKKCAIIGLASLSFSAFAGNFHAVGLGSGVDISGNISDLVSDKFIAKFPATKYSITVIYDFHTYTDGGGVGFAVAGVTPRNQDASKGWYYAPYHRYTSTRRMTGQSINSYKKNELTIEVIRQAVELLMAECDKSPTCDVLK